MSKQKKIISGVASTAVLMSVATSAFAATVNDVVPNSYKVGKDIYSQNSSNLTAANVVNSAKNSTDPKPYYKTASGHWVDVSKVTAPSDVLNPATSPAAVPANTVNSWELGTYYKDGIATEKLEQGNTGELQVASVTATNKTTLKVTFSKDVDPVSKANFTVNGKGVVGAALDSQNKKVAIVDISGLGLDYGKTYDVVINGVTANGQTLASVTKQFTTPTVQESYEVKLTPEKSRINSDGNDLTPVTLELIDKGTNKVDEKANDMVLSVTTTWGNLSTKRITVQNGKANFTLRSETLAAPQTAQISATIIEAIDDYKPLIGLKSNEASVILAPAGMDVETPDRQPILAGAQSGQADSVILFFNKDISIDHLVKKDAKGQIEVETTDTARKVGQVKLYADNNGANKTEIEIKQGSITKDIWGFKAVPGNPKAIEVILYNKGIKDNIAPASTQFLDDNQWVEVKAVIKGDGSLAQQTPKKFLLTDARKPEVTGVTQDGLNKIKVKFSKPIVTPNADDLASKVIVNAGALPVKDATVGEFNQVTGTDERNILTVTLKDGVYLKPGKNSIQLAGIIDFAGIVDKVQNTAETQTLDFDVLADVNKPSATVTEESPEQFRVVFGSEVTGFPNDTSVTLTTDTAAKNPIYLQRKNATTGVWENVDVSSFPDKAPSVTGLQVYIKKVAKYPKEYVVTLKQDWTQLYNTNTTKKNHFSDQYRFVIPKDTVMNPLNGLKNDADIILSLPELQKPDTVSPKIVSMKTTATANEFEVTMTKPVKLGAILDSSGASTPSQSQGAVPEPLISFIGVDKSGMKREIDGKVVKYSSDRDDDTKFIVTTKNAEVLQNLVNSGEFGEDWTLVVKSISDDTGNTAETLTENFKITKATGPVTDDAFTVRDNSNTYVWAHHDRYEIAQDQVVKNNKIYITYTSNVSFGSDLGSATATTNYTLNGAALPAGTSIQAVDLDEKAGTESVVINLPAGTLLPSDNNVIRISPYLKSTTGKQITGTKEFVITMIDRDEITNKTGQITAVKVPGLVVNNTGAKVKGNPTEVTGNVIVTGKNVTLDDLDIKGTLTVTADAQGTLVLNNVNMKNLDVKPY